MKKIIIGLTVIFGQFALAQPVKLLDCTPMFGPDQEITIVQDGQKLTLIEDAGNEGIKTRELSQSEWRSGKVQLRDDGNKNILSVTDGYLTTTGGGFNQSGSASCE